MESSHATLHHKTPNTAARIQLTPQSMNMLIQLQTASAQLRESRPLSRAHASVARRLRRATPENAHPAVPHSSQHYNHLTDQNQCGASNTWKPSTKSRWPDPSTACVHRVRSPRTERRPERSVNCTDAYSLRKTPDTNRNKPRVI